MEVFFTLLLKLIPLYITVILGYIAGRFLKVDGQNISKLMFYMISPVVIFNSLLHTKINLSVISLPFLILGIGVSLAYASLYIGRKIWRDSTPNVLALTAGTANSGFFGIPVAMLVLDEATVGIYITAMIGMTIFENSFGFYITAKSSMTAADALKKVIRLPSLYAFLTGTIFSISGIAFPDFFESFAKNMTGAYTILGMMIVGFGVAKAGKFFSRKTFGHPAFILLASLIKFAIWPLIIFVILALDTLFFNFYAESIHRALILISIVPIAANTVVIATILNAHPDKVAVTVLITTIFALFYVPLMVALFLR